MSAFSSRRFERVVIIAVGIVTAVAAASTAAADVTPSPHVAGRGVEATTNSTLYAVSVAPRSTTAWALGHAVKQGSPAIGDRVLRVRGKKWSKATVIGAPKDSTHLNGVSAATAKLAWVVGDYQKRHVTSPHYLPLLAKSTGGAFRRVKVPHFRNGRLIGIAALSRTNAWAIGVKTSGGPVNASFHWNGKTVLRCERTHAAPCGRGDRIGWSSGWRRAAISRTP